MLLVLELQHARDCLRFELCRWGNQSTPSKHSSSNHWLRSRGKVHWSPLSGQEYTKRLCFLNLRDIGSLCQAW